MRVLLKSPWDSIEDVLVERFPFVIGRSSKVDHNLGLVFVSRSHCRFSLQDGKVCVEDIGSSNGTFVNGKRITTPTALHHDDQLSLGPLAFRVIHLGKQTGASPEASTLLVPPEQPPVFNPSPEVTQRT